MKTRNEIAIKILQDELKVAKYFNKSFDGITHEPISDAMRDFYKEKVSDLQIAIKILKKYDK